MKMTYFNLVLALCITSVTFTACEKDTDSSTNEQSTSLSVTTAEDVQADTLGTGHYTFFSLKDSSIVALSDSATTKWDIGFKNTSIIVNGGTSGPGNGGAFMYTGLFTDVTTVPDSTFKQDNGSSFAISSWYSYTGAATVPNHAILPLAGKVIIIRTADNKYAKLEISSYYKGNPNTASAEFADLATRPKSRFFTFRYVYQPNGSKKLN